MLHNRTKQKIENDGYRTKRALSRRAFIVVAILFLLIPDAVVLGQGGEEKTLIIYYSRTGMSKTICETLQKNIDADLLEIKDLKGRSGFWGYITTAYDSFFDRETEIFPLHPDLSPYSAVVVVSPIWNWKICVPIRTLLKNNSFKGEKFVMYTNANIDIKKYDNFGDDAPFIKRFLRDYLRDKKNLMQELGERTGADITGHYHIATKTITKRQLVKLTRDSVKYVQQKLSLPRTNRIASS